MKIKITEEQIAAIVVQWLTDMRWTVYQEVQCESYGKIADIVARNEKGILWIIETKQTFGLKLLDQAYKWIGMAHYISVAVPKFQISFIGDKILKSCGMGYLYVNTENTVRELIHPNFQRKLSLFNIGTYLTDAHKTFAKAGNARGDRYTPFQQTCRNILNWVKLHPGITLKELLSDKNFKTHYCSINTAKSCILKWGTQGLIKGVEFRLEGKSYKLYPKELSGENHL